MNSKLMGISRRKWLSRTVASLALASGLPVSAQTGSIESVVILAFTAFGCGFSAQADAVLRAIKAKYGARVQVRYKFLPLDDGANTMMLHEVALFAGNQGNQNEMVSLLHALGDKSDFLDLKAAVFNKLSLGNSEWLGAQKGGQLRAQLDNDLLDAQALKVQATPTFFVAGFKLEGLQRQEVLEQLVDFQLASQARNQPIEQLLGASRARRSTRLDQILGR